MRFVVSSGIAVRSMAGFTEPGDAAVALQSGTTWLFALVDALGHGPDAATSASCVCETLRAMPDRPLSEIFRECDRRLVRQRGAVMGAVRFDGDGAVFAGIGNVELYGPPRASAPPALSGVLGGGLRSFREFPLPLGPGQRWVLASDGICARDLRARWRESVALDPTQAATKLLELTGRRDDDASLLVMDYALSPAERETAPGIVHDFTTRTRIECFAAGRRGKELAIEAGWPAQAAEEVSLLVVELTNNACRHGGGGRCRVEMASHRIHVIVEDEGPGFPARVLERHARAQLIEGLEAGPRRVGLGIGLDSARRMCDELKLENRSPRGARVSVTRRR